MGVEYPRWGAFMFQNGAAMTNEDNTAMTLDTPEAREALEFVAGLYQDGFAVKPAAVDAGWAGEAFGQGKAAMVIEGNWLPPAMTADFPDATTRWPSCPRPGRAGHLRLHRLLRGGSRCRQPGCVLGAGRAPDQ